MATAETTTNITEAHRSLFNALTSGKYDNFALVSTTFDGEPTAAIATVTFDNGEYLVVPVAVVVTEAMFSRMTGPGDENPTR